MALSDDQKNILKQCADTYPYPIAAACQRYLAESPEDPWRSWELLSRNILQSVLHYMSHLLLSDLIALGEKPPRLFHHIQAILSRPMAGQYVGFLRETARHYRDGDLSGSVQELVDFLVDSEIDCNLLDGNRPLLGQAVAYRNAFAHGRVVQKDAIASTSAEVLDLTIHLLQQIHFLTRYPLRLEDGTDLMGHTPWGLSRKPQPLQVVTARGMVMRMSSGRKIQCPIFWKICCTTKQAWTPLE
jgi:hypothetical protein